MRENMHNAELSIGIRCGACIHEHSVSWDEQQSCTAQLSQALWPQRGLQLLAPLGLLSPSGEMHTASGHEGSEASPRQAPSRRPPGFQDLILLPDRCPVCSVLILGNTRGGNDRPKLQSSLVFIRGLHFCRCWSEPAQPLWTEEGRDQLLPTEVHHGLAPARCLGGTGVLLHPAASAFFGSLWCLLSTSPCQTDQDTFSAFSPSLTLSS